MSYAKQQAQKLDFVEKCYRYGFDPEDYQREFKYYSDRLGYRFARLIGFSGDRCILEISSSDAATFHGVYTGATKKERFLPSETMRFMRLYYNDKAQAAREKRDMKKCSEYLAMAKMITKKMEKAGWESHPTDIFNAYGTTENAHLNLRIINGKYRAPAIRL